MRATDLRASSVINGGLAMADRVTTWTWSRTGGGAFKEVSAKDQLQVSSLKTNFFVLIVQAVIFLSIFFFDFSVVPAVAVVIITDFNRLTVVVVSPDF